MRNETQGAQGAQGVDSPVPRSRHGGLISCAELWEEQTALFPSAQMIGRDQVRVPISRHAGPDPGAAPDPGFMKKR